MALPEDLTADYVNVLSYSKYSTRTADTASFNAVKSMMMVYINTDPCFLPAKKATHALALLVCHYYALDDTETPDIGGSDTAKGSVASETVGNVSISYSGTPSMNPIDGSKAYLSQTKYGQEFLYLMKTFRPSPLVV